MARKALKTTEYAGLSHVGTYLDEDLPILNANMEIIDAQLAQAAKERDELREAANTADEALGRAVDARLKAEAVTRADADSNHAAQTAFAGAHGFPKGKEGQVLIVRGGTLVWVDYHEIVYVPGEIYLWRHPTLKTGFQPAQGGLLAGAADKYPEFWAYLQTTEGKKLCKTEAEWQAMTRAVWHTNADGSQVGWNGIGGAPWYAPDFNTGALRLPDVRGMYIEAGGYDGLGVGDRHGDAMRTLWGTLGVSPVDRWIGTSGGFYGRAIAGQGASAVVALGGEGFHYVFDPGRVAPVANKNQPRAWGALACVYLGAPK